MQTLEEQLQEEREGNQALFSEVQRLKADIQEAAWRDWRGEMAAVQQTSHRIMRDWHAVPELAWHNVGASNWRATWNNIELGGYCDEPSPYRVGCAVWWGNTKFTTRIDTAAEARNAINEKFIEWLRLAAGTFLENTIVSEPGRKTHE